MLCGVAGNLAFVTMFAADSSNYLKASRARFLRSMVSVELYLVLGNHGGQPTVSCSRIQFGQDNSSS
jgi:hypothetical protein